MKIQKRNLSIIKAVLLAYALHLSDNMPVFAMDSAELNDKKHSTTASKKPRVKENKKGNSQQHTEKPSVLGHVMDAVLDGTQAVGYISQGKLRKGVITAGKSFESSNEASALWGKDN